MVHPVRVHAAYCNMYKDEGVGGDYDYTDHPDLIYSLALQLLLSLLHAGEGAEALAGDVTFMRVRVVTHMVSRRGWGGKNVKCRFGKSIISVRGTKARDGK